MSMNEHICYIVGAAPLDGRLPKPEEGDYLIAADAGYAALRASGLEPDFVMGDFDSLGAPPEHPNVETHSVIKDDTDLMLAVRWALEQGWRKFRIYGALGGKRLDQTLASLQTLRFWRKTARAACWSATAGTCCCCRTAPSGFPERRPAG